MAAAARLSPKDFFTDQEWAPISARSSWRGPAMIAHAWALILAAGAMVVVWPLTLPLAVTLKRLAAPRLLFILGMTAS